MKKSVFIATPMYGGMCTHGFTSGFAENLLDLKEHKIDVMWSFIGNESLVTRGRNNLAAQFLESGFTHLMFIDGDIHFPKGSIRKLLECKKDLVCAPYPKKYIDWQRIQNKIKSTIGNIDNIEEQGSSFVINYIDSHNIPEPDKKGLIEVLHAGTGFMLISRQVFNKIGPNMKRARASNFGRMNNWYTEFFYTDVDEDGVFQSEDWVFCNNWRKAGGKIYMNTEINLSHIGMYVYKGDMVRNGANIT